MAQIVSSSGDTSADNVDVSGGVTVAPRPYALSEVAGPLGRAELADIDAWWRAANYLAVGQIYLRRNPLLTEPLRAEDIKARLL